MWIEVKKKTTFPITLWVSDNGINQDRITVGKEPAGLLGRRWIQVEIFKALVEYTNGYSEQEFGEISLKFERSRTKI